jgi:CRP/FNR family transcriptional regulator, cyclic AMP receptor protein
MTTVREISCKDCRTLDHCVLSNLTEPQLDELNKAGIVCRYKKKQRIFYQGEPCLGLFILCSGQVKLTRANRFGKEQILSIVDPPGLLEEKDLFTTERHGGSAEAIDDVTITFVKKEVLLDLFKKNPETALAMIVKLARELEGAQDRIEAMTFKDGRRRLAELLLKLANEYGRSGVDGVLLNLKLTRAEIAEMMGTTQETTIRLISRFKKEKLIKDHMQNILILDQDQLKRIAQ